MESRKGVFRGLLSCFCINIDVHPVQHHQADSPENDGSPRGFAWSSGEPAVCLRECRVTWFLQLFIRKFQSSFISWDIFFSWGILWWNFGNHCILAPKSRSHLHANKKTGLNNDIERQVQVDTWNNTHGTVLLEKHIRNHRSWDILGPLETEPNSRNTAICPDVQVPIGSYGTNLFDIATNLPWKSTTLGISGQKLPLSWILCVFFWVPPTLFISWNVRRVRGSSKKSEAGSIDLLRCTARFGETKKGWIISQGNKQDFLWKLLLGGFKKTFWWL